LNNPRTARRLDRAIARPVPAISHGKTPSFILFANSQLKKPKATRRPGAGITLPIDPAPPHVTPTAAFSALHALLATARIAPQALVQNLVRIAQVLPTRRRASRPRRHLFIAQVARVARPEPVARPGSIARRTGRLPPDSTILAGVGKISAPPAAVAPLIGRLEMSPAG
jgi:hypothetical protein